MDGSFFAEEGRRVKHPAAADRSVPVVERSRHRPERATEANLHASGTLEWAELRDVQAHLQGA